MKTALRFKSTYFQILLYLISVFLLALTSINIKNYLAPKAVLGVEATQEQDYGAFWQEFVDKNPDYIPGWIELGQMDKATKIDPNYIKP